MRKKHASQYANFGSLQKNIYPIFRSIFLIGFKLFILYQNTPYIDYTNDQPEDKQIEDS